MIYMGDEYGEYGGADPDNRHMWRIINHRMKEKEVFERTLANLGIEIRT